ncbi:hypothetical protein K443DRAFT_470008 [Laccaria amethystina LaAM-08-1]|uniref:Uncharacterized protein n=1 Tax=Laccaria amethystina LaAM-08-1 TaxID=1095629 RepID=A0A0C9WVR4_9AGAR|nr:hypothetical protein K443DRAFT_470008 [Laccaria amethystina LaAM-08-1]
MKRNKKIWWYTYGYIWLLITPYASCTTPRRTEIFWMMNRIKSNEKDSPIYTEPDEIGPDRRGINAASVSSKGGLFVSAGGSDDGSGGKKHGEADRHATIT